MRLRELLAGVEVVSPLSLRDAEVLGIASHSKQVKDDFLFVAVGGARFNGCDFIDEALNRGAKVIVHDSPRLEDETSKKRGVSFVKVRDIYGSLAKIANNFYRKPSAKVKVIAATGTNGKTTTTYLAESIVRTAGSKIGVIGTVNYRFNGRVIPASNTTPGAIQLQELIYNMEKSRLDYIVMEVSSHGIQQRRIEGIDFKAGIFTNITLDHLDYHKTFKNYFNVKAKFFEDLSPSSWAIINIDDPYGRELIMRTEAKTITYAIDSPADVEAGDITSKISGSRFSIITPYGRLEINTPLIGMHNIYNILAAVAFGISEDLDLNSIKQGIESVSSIPGRLEAVELGQPFKVFIDYAHTDDALKNILLSMRQISRGRIILAFGCGGDRYQDKRPLMGRVASRFADYIIITTDNPRSEEPETIIKEIEQGFPDGFTNFRVILDRYAAIKEAICSAEAEDMVIIAGKGHEAYQIFKNTAIPFDDRSVAKQVLREVRMTGKFI